MNKYWVSWRHYAEMGDFIFKDENPCWETGELYAGRPIITYVVAIKTFDEYLAKKEVFNAYDQQVEEIDFIFAVKKPAKWSPFCERFPRADWMVWE